MKGIAEPNIVCYNLKRTHNLVYMEKYPSLVEGTGLENREVGNGAGVRIPLSPPFNVLNNFVFISRSGAAW